MICLLHKVHTLMGCEPLLKDALITTDVIKG